MSNKNQKKVLTAAMTAALLLQSSLTGTVGAVLAQEEEPQSLYEQTAPTLTAEESTAVYAGLKISDKLDYGEYGIERNDIPGVSYVFSITTKDGKDVVINEDQIAYCIQSYFLTPLTGDHSTEMTDQVSAVNGGRNLHKVLYYGYGGAGYDAAEFEAFLSETDAEYYENVYQLLSDEAKQELAYILTHSAASYAYFNDGTDFEEYLGLQFEMKYGEDWERQYGYFKEQELERAGITEDDMNLYGSTYGMTSSGIGYAKGWYELLTSKMDPGIGLEESGDGLLFYGNGKNEELKLGFVVPEGFVCEITDTDGEMRLAREAEQVSVRPGEEFSFTYVEDLVSAEAGGLADLTAQIEGTLFGTENEAWNLVLLETNKGTNRTVDKRQQDIAAVSMMDAGRTELDFAVELQKGNISVQITDEVQQPVSGAVLGVYYDEACSVPVKQDGEAVQLTTDEQGNAYLEFVMNQNLEENGTCIYVKQLSVPEGNAADERVLCVAEGNHVSLVSERVFEAAEVPVACQVNLSGRSLKDGEFVFELIPVTDETGETTVQGVAAAAAKNDTDGNVVFEGISVSEPGTYYYKVVSENGSFIAVAEATADESEKGQLNVSVTYPEGQPQFEEVYEASDETALEGIQVTLENDALEAGEFTFELKDEAGNVIQRASNDASGQVVFENLSYTQDDIGKEFVYTVSQVTDAAHNAYEESACTITVKVEDSDSSDGTLKITQEISGAVFENRRVFEEMEVPITCQVNLSGRDLKEGEYTFDLTQVTDVSGEVLLEGGAAGTASNRTDGSVVFEGISIGEPGIYYYKVDSEKGSFIAVVEATADSSEKGKLNISVTYPEGQPQFEEVYEASGEAVLEGIQVALTNDTLEAGEFTFELKDAQGNVLQTASNDADGNVVFDSIAYTQDDIGKEYVYTVSQVSGENADMTYDEDARTITVKVEDSEASDGTLQVTQFVDGEAFCNVYVEPETEVMTETETEVITEAVTETETEVITEAVTETETEVITEAVTETETEAITEAVTETETERITEEVTESETEHKEETSGFVLPVSISFIILLILWILRILIRWYRRRA